jgi:hypothetical protein
MPKILINEEDFTTPGTPEGYANYSVLIAGLQKEFTDDELEDIQEEITTYKLAKQVYTIKLNTLSDTPTEEEIAAYHAPIAEALEIYNDAIDCGIYTADKFSLDRPAAGATNVVLQAYRKEVEAFIAKLTLLSEKAQLSSEAQMVLARDEKMDYNGVYEFSSVQDFLNTVGAVAPHSATYSHYGNQMAYELLKQGYTVIYLPISGDNLVATLTSETTWEIFKDKASYDFRFIHHGLLESTDAAIIKGCKDRVDNLKNTTLQTLANKAILSFDTETFDITIGGITHELAKVPNQDFEEVAAVATAYSELYQDLVDEELEDNNLKDDDDEYYTDWRDAVKAVAKLMSDALSTRNNCVDSGTINTVNTNIANLAKYATEDSAEALPGRGDCVALIELDENKYANTSGRPEVAIIEAINSLSIDGGNGKYCALTVPSVVYNMTETTVSINGEVVANAYAGNKKLPGGFHYLACFMNSLRSNFREWYAAAGYTRGVSSYSILNTTVPLGEIAINALEPRSMTVGSPKFACNVIANFRGSYYLWGNRTAHPLSQKASGGDLVASHFLNIRQLCCTIKKQLYVACRRFTFDPNSDTLWFNFVNAIKPTLEAMKADQGVRDYKIMKVTTDKKATLKAKIRIIPIEAVEDFDLTVSLEDSFGETTAAVTE